MLFVADRTLYGMNTYVPTQVPQTVGDSAVVGSQALGIGMETGWLIGNNSGDQVVCVSQARQEGIHKYH